MDFKVEPSHNCLSSNSDSSKKIQPSLSVDSLLDNVMRNEQMCTPCDHQSAVSKPRRPLGNREAVKKYREKKKAHMAYLEEEVKKLRLVNHQLMIKLQRRAVLEKEMSRLRRILHGIGEKIDAELSTVPFQEQCDISSTIKEGNFGVEFTNLDDVHYLTGSSISPFNIGGSDSWKIMDVWQNNCQPLTVDRQADTNYVERAK